MANKNIDIKISSSFNADGVLEANRGLAKLAQDVKSANDEMQKATMRAEMSVNSYAENADKAVRAMGGGYKTLEQQLAELGKGHTSVGERATTAGAAATKSAIGLEMAMGLARGSTEQTAKAFALLSQKIPVLGKLGVAACGAWAAAIGGVMQLLSATKDLISTVFNLDSAPEEIKEASNAMLGLNNAAELFKVSMDEARAASKAQLKTIEDEADALNKVTKAQIELNRQRELGAAKTDKQRAAINAAADSANAAADEDTAQQKRDAKRQSLYDEMSRLDVEDRESKKTIAKSQKFFGRGQGAEDVALDARESIAQNEQKRKEIEAAIDGLNKEEEVAEALIEARKLKEESATKRTKSDEAKAQETTNLSKMSVDEQVDYFEKKLRDLESEKHTIEIDIEERRQPSNSDYVDRLKKAKESQKKERAENYDTFLKSGSTDTFDQWLAAQKKAKADKLKADKTAFAEYQRKSGIDTTADADKVDEADEAFKRWRANRDKQVTEERTASEKLVADKAAAEQKAEAERHKTALDNINAEIAAKQAVGDIKQSTAERAQTEFDKAFAMYRSEDRGAAQIAEERDYAADYKQLKKDAAHYGGKWRIDELSELIAAGDTKGQQAKLEEWRKSKSFTPEVESMVRAAAADETKTTAEDELRKISKNTEDLGKKLEELLAMK